MRRRCLLACCLLAFGNEGMVNEPDDMKAAICITREVRKPWRFLSDIMRTYCHRLKDPAYERTRKDQTISNSNRLDRLATTRTIITSRVRPRSTREAPDRPQERDSERLDKLTAHEERCACGN